MTVYPEEEDLVSKYQFLRGFQTRSEAAREILRFSLKRLKRVYAEATGCSTSKAPAQIDEWVQSVYRG